MGGMGSGQRWSKKHTVEQCHAIDTRDLKRWNLLVPGTANRAGSFEWRRLSGTSSVSYSLSVGPSAGSLRVMYSMAAPEARFDYVIRLEAVACRFGGARWWLRCPLSKNGVGCGRRVRKLYLCGRYFGCRHCHALVYRSSQESDGRVYAMARAGLNAIPRVEGASVSQLGVALTALTLMQKRLRRPIR